MRKPQFLNVDLEIQSVSKLEPLAAAMGKRVMVLHCGLGHKPRLNLLVVEVSGFRKTADSTIHRLCAIVETLPPAAGRLWRGAKKQFDVGWELPPSQRFYQFSLRPETLARIAKLDATLTVTCYPEADENVDVR